MVKPMAKKTQNAPKRILSNAEVKQPFIERSAKWVVANLPTDYNTGYGDKIRVEYKNDEIHRMFPTGSHYYISVIYKDGTTSVLKAADRIRVTYL